jgi:hypothetical protein
MTLVREAVAAACGWVDAQLDVAWAPDALLPSLKVAGELGHAADVLARSQVPDWAATGGRWLDRVSAWLDGGRVVRAVISRDPSLVNAAITFLPLHLQGRTDPELVDLVRAQVARAELHPLAWAVAVPALALLGVDCGPAARARAATISVITNTPPPDRIPLDAMYLLAHEWFYATGWGRGLARATGAEVYLAAALPTLIARAVALDDPDILVELLLATHFLPGSPCADAPAWQLVHAAQRTDGSVAARERTPMLVPRLEHPRMSRTYHTTVSAIMAWASCVHRR